MRCKKSENAPNHKVKFSGEDLYDDSTHFFIYFSTQNTRVKGETPKQKLEVPPMFSKHIDKIFAAYPKYVSVKDLKETDDPEGLKAFLSELAYL